MNSDEKTNANQPHQEPHTATPGEARNESERASASFLLNYVSATNFRPTFSGIKISRPPIFANTFQTLALTCRPGSALSGAEHCRARGSLLDLSVARGLVWAQHQDQRSPWQAGEPKWIAGTRLGVSRYSLSAVLRDAAFVVEDDGEWILRYLEARSMVRFSARLEQNISRQLIFEDENAISRFLEDERIKVVVRDFVRMARRYRTMIAATADEVVVQAETLGARVVPRGGHVPDEFPAWAHTIQDADVYRRPSLVRRDYDEFAVPRGMWTCTSVMTDDMRRARFEVLLQYLDAHGKMLRKEPSMLDGEMFVIPRGLTSWDRMPAAHLASSFVFVEDKSDRWWQRWGGMLRAVRGTAYTFEPPSLSLLDASWELVRRELPFDVLAAGS